MQNLKCHICQNPNAFICYCGKSVCECCFGFIKNQHQKITDCCQKISCRDIKYFNCERCNSKFCSRCILKLNEKIYCKKCIANIKNLDIYKYCNVCDRWYNKSLNNKCDVCNINCCNDCLSKIVYKCPRCNVNICYKREHYRFGDYIETCGNCWKVYCKKCYNETVDERIKCVLCGIEYCEDCLNKMKFCLSCQEYHCLNCIKPEYKCCQFEHCNNIIPKRCFDEDINRGFKINYNITKHLCYRCCDEFYACNYCKKQQRMEFNNENKYLCPKCYK